MDLEEVVSDAAEALVRIDRSGQAFRAFQPGVGPYGEPQVVRGIASHFNELPKYHGTFRTRRTPDLLIPDQWAIEFKITRPYGDTGKEAENWSVNLLHPYPGNVSTIGDCYKLARFSDPERGAVAVSGYERAPPRIDITPLVESFEVIAKHVAHIRLSSRIEAFREGLVDPVHQSLKIFAWEVLERIEQ